MILAWTLCCVLVRRKKKQRACTPSGFPFNGLKGGKNELSPIR